MNEPALQGRGATAAPRADGYELRAFAVVRVPLGDIAQVRQTVGLPGEPPFPAAFLKAADEQTVVAVAAVMRAIAEFGLRGENFARWGVVAASRFLGRLSAAETIHRFETGGAWKAPPLFVPHRSLHAVAGTISQALQSRGPNFGVGGGANALVEGLLTTLTVLDGHDLPGLWSVLTQCDPEPRPNREGVNAEPVVCHALALAFTPAIPGGAGLRLRLLETGEARVAADDRASRFDRLAEFLQERAAGHEPCPWRCPLSWGGELRLAAA